jgi:Uma2 family endonuclease
MVDPAGFQVDALDPRAPSQALWDRLSDAERRRIVDALPSDFPSASPPEGDPHWDEKRHVREALDEYFRRIRRRIYLSCELPVYYPDAPVIAPDLIAVRDVELRPRMRWVVSAEGRGIDLALEIHVAGDARKDFVENVVRFAALGIPEYFAYDVGRRRIAGWRLRDDTRVYSPIIPQDGRWHSEILDLDLALDQSGIRFFHGSAPLPDARELIGRLSGMIDDAVRRAEEEARRAEEEARRAEVLAAKLRALGIDPDA